MQESIVHSVSKSVDAAQVFLNQVAEVKFIALDNQMSLGQIQKMLKVRKLNWAPKEVAELAVKDRLEDCDLPSTLKRDTKCVIWHEGKKFRFVNKGFFKRAGGCEIFDRNDILVAIPI